MRAPNIASVKQNLVRFDGQLHLGALLGSRRWTGTQWLPVGDLSRVVAGPIKSVVRYGSEVLVGGPIQSAGGVDGTSTVAAWNGQRWRAVGSGPELVGTLNQLVERAGNVWALGSFEVPGTSDRTIASMFDGLTWTNFGPTTSATARRGVFFNDELYVIGDFDLAPSMGGGLARVSSGALSLVAGAIVTGPSDVTVYDGQLVVSGEFATFPGGPPLPYPNDIVAWNGTSWRVLRPPWHSFWFDKTPQHLIVHNGRLITAGDFQFPLSRIAEWTGTDWTYLGFGLPRAPTSLASIDGVLYAFGTRFDCPGGVCSAHGVSRWDGFTWTLGDAPTGIKSIARYNGELIAGGSFATNFQGRPTAHWARYGPAEPRPCPADVTATNTPGQPGFGVPSGSITHDDFHYYLDQFTLRNLAACDLTGSALPGDPCYGRPNGVLNNDDFFYFLAAFAKGC